jgi:hypothetical protein
LPNLNGRRAHKKYIKKRSFTSFVASRPITKERSLFLLLVPFQNTNWQNRKKKNEKRKRNEWKIEVNIILGE